MSTRKIIFFTGLIIPFLAVFIVKMIFYSNAETAVGIVVSKGEITFRGLSGENEPDKEFSIIEYNVDGRKYEYKQGTEVLFKKMEPGDSIEMIYDPEDPEKAYIYSFFGFWWRVPTLIIVALIVGVWIGVFSMIPKNKRVES